VWLADTHGTCVTSRAFRRRGSEASFDYKVAKRVRLAKLHESEDLVAENVNSAASGTAPPRLKRAGWHSSLDRRWRRRHTAGNVADSFR
jgi:hypothetical protein